MVLHEYILCPKNILTLKCGKKTTKFFHLSQVKDTWGLCDPTGSERLFQLSARAQSHSVGMAKSIPIPSKNRFLGVVSSESILDTRESIPRIDASSESTSIPIIELMVHLYLCLPDRCGQPNVQGCSHDQFSEDFCLRKM